MEYNDLNQISKERWGGGFGIRREDCEALDKLQEAFDWYNWGISEGHEDRIENIHWIFRTIRLFKGIQR